MSRSQALVFGGTGTVGREVLKGLAAAGIPTVFTWHRAEERAHALARAHGQRPVQADLADPNAARAVARESEADIFIHCASVAPTATAAATTDDVWRGAQAVNVHSAFAACQELALAMARRGEGHVVFVGALDRTQSLPLPVVFAATQGMLSAMVMALAKELAPQVLVNMVALGPLDAGLSGRLDPALLDDYKAMSALRRLGRPEEAAQAILWLALENTYMTGRVLAVNGGV